MLGAITQELFPDECRVLEIVPDVQYVYPIFKNGSTSLFKSGHREISKQQLSTVKNVEVYVRDPHERFISGVKSYLNGLDKSLDKNTAMYFVKTYPYLNRHFCPQIFWLMNLQRFSNASITIKPVEQLFDIIVANKNKSQTDTEIAEYFEQSSKVRFYNEIDEVLTVNLIGRTVAFEEIVELIKQNYSEVYSEMFLVPRKIFNVVS